MDIIAWLREKWFRVTWWFSDAYLKARAVFETWYDKLTEYLGTFYSWVGDLFNNFKAKLYNFVRDWHLKIWTFITFWYGKIQEYANTLYEWLQDLYYKWKAKLLEYVQDWYLKIWTFITFWYAKVGEYVNSYRDVIKAWVIDKAEELKKLVSDWYLDLQIYVLSWKGALGSLADTWYNKILWFVQTNYLAFLLLREEWWAKLDLLVNALVGKLYLLVFGLWELLLAFLQLPFAALNLLSRLWFEDIKRWVDVYQAPVASFFQDPAGMVLGVIETHAWRFGEWLLASMLGGVRFVPPPRPPITGGGSPPPPGYQPPRHRPGEMIWPVSSRRISGYRFNPPTHNGLDIGLATGDPVWSIADGTVSITRWDATGYGVWVQVNHTNGWNSRYAHLQAIYVTQGQAVSQGQILGAGDSTGNSTGPHLHIELRDGGSLRNPELYLT